MFKTEIDSACWNLNENNKSCDEVSSAEIKVKKSSFSLQQKSRMQMAHERWESFERNVWPHSTIDVVELAKAGFYFYCVRDFTKCFACGIIIHDWCASDRPWEEHAFWNPMCPHVKDIKGQEFIDSVNKNWLQHNKK